jgi:hypothetical protein
MQYFTSLLNNSSFDVWIEKSVATQLKDLFSAYQCTKLISVYLP